MEPTPTLEAILERLKTPSVLTPREVTESYMFLSQLYANYCAQLADAMAESAILEGRYVYDGETSAKARALTDGREEGQKVIKLKGRVKGLEEIIKSLKKAQQFMSDEARNLL